VEWILDYITQVLNIRGGGHVGASLSAGLSMWCGLA